MTLDQALKVRESDIRWDYARTHPLLVTLVTGAFLVSIATIVMPTIVSDSSIGAILVPVLRWAWALSYLAGSLGVLYAFWIKVTNPHASIKIEACALVHLAVCFAVYALAVVANRSVQGDVRPGVLAASVFGSLSIGCALRALSVVTEPDSPWRKRRS